VYNLNTVYGWRFPDDGKKEPSRTRGLTLLEKFSKGTPVRQKEKEVRPTDRGTANGDQVDAGGEWETHLKRGVKRAREKGRHRSALIAYVQDWPAIPWDRNALRGGGALVWGGLSQQGKSQRTQSAFGPGKEGVQVGGGRAHARSRAVPSNSCRSMIDITSALARARAGSHSRRREGQLHGLEGRLD